MLDFFFLSTYYKNSQFLYRKFQLEQLKYSCCFWWFGKMRWYEKEIVWLEETNIVIKKINLTKCQLMSLFSRFESIININLLVDKRGNLTTYHFLMIFNRENCIYLEKIKRYKIFMFSSEKINILYTLCIKNDFHYIEYIFECLSYIVVNFWVTNFPSLHIFSYHQKRERYVSCLTYC